MSVRSFFDTSILVCADDKAAPGKQRRALDLVAEHRRARTGVVRGNRGGGSVVCNGAEETCTALPGLD